MTLSSTASPRSLIRQDISPSGKLLIDLPGLSANDLPPAAIPTNISTTTRPDLVLVTESSISMLELTVPTNSHQGIQAARQEDEQAQL